MNKPEESKDNTTLCRRLAEVLGTDAVVNGHIDAHEQTRVDVLTVTDLHDKNIRFHCTVGVSDFPNLIETKTGPDVNIPVELLIGAGKEFTRAADLLAACGFHIIEAGWPCQRGSVLKGLVAKYYPSSAMKHVLFVQPLPWADKLSQIQLENKTVHFLLAVPISEHELQYFDQNGVQALEELLFQEKEIDLYDLSRKSAL